MLQGERLHLNDSAETQLIQPQARAKSIKLWANHAWPRDGHPALATTFDEVSASLLAEFGKLIESLVKNSASPTSCS